MGAAAYGSTRTPPNISGINDATHASGSTRSRKPSSGKKKLSIQ